MVVVAAVAGTANAPDSKTVTADTVINFFIASFLPLFNVTKTIHKYLRYVNTGKKTLVEVAGSCPPRPELSKPVFYKLRLYQPRCCGLRLRSPPWWVFYLFKSRGAHLELMLPVVH